MPDMPLGLCWGEKRLTAVALDGRLVTFQVRGRSIENDFGRSVIELPKLTSTEVQTRNAQAPDQYCSQRVPLRRLCTGILFA